MMQERDQPIENFYYRLFSRRKPRSFLEGFLKGFFASGMTVFFVKMVIDLDPQRSLYFVLGSACIGGARGIQNQPARSHLHFFERVTTPLAPQTSVEGRGKGFIAGLIFFIALNMNSETISNSLFLQFRTGALSILCAMAGGDWWGARNQSRRP